MNYVQSDDQDLVREHFAPEEGIAIFLELSRLEIQEAREVLTA